MDGYNATIFAYGQSVHFTQGSGKTFTMLGPEEVTNALVNEVGVSSEDLQSKFGIIPRAIYSLFTLADSHSRDLVDWAVKCSYTEIYNESVNDLLSDTPNTNLRIREFPRLGMCVIGMTEKFATSPEEVFECLAAGTRRRITAATGQNSRSSRSHTLFSLVVEQKLLNGSLKTSKLNLVDLAGSEKVSKTGVTGKQLKEAQNINLSLTTLGRCINALASSKETHVPFRESKLTMILRESLGGNAKTALVCTASQKIHHLEEADGTLKFAERAKKVTVKAKTNLRQSPEEMATVIEQLKLEVTSLRAQLRDKNEAGLPAEPSDAVYIQYAELKAQYESLNETSQIEIERLRGKVDQLSEQGQPVSYAERLQEHLDRMEEAEDQIESLTEENETLRERLQEEAASAWARTEAIERSNLQQCVDLQKLATELATSRQDSAALQLRLAEQTARAETAMETERALAATNTQLASARAEQLALSDQVAQLHTQLVETQGLLSAASHQEDALRGKLHMQAADLAAAHSALTQANKAASDLHSALKAAEVQRQEFEERHQEVIVKMGEHIRQLEGSSHRTDTTSSEEGPMGNSPPKKTSRAKSVISKLISELMQLKAAYESTQAGFSLEVAQIRQESEERIHNLEQNLSESQAALYAQMQSYSDLDKAFKLAGIELESSHFHLKLTKSELSTVRSSLSEERQTRQSLESELLRLREDLSERSAPDSDQIARLLQESQQTYMSLVASQQEALQRHAEEIASLRQALQRKDTELREVTQLERSIELQLSKAIIRIQKQDRQLKQPVMPAPRGERMQSMLMPAPRGGRRQSMLIPSLPEAFDRHAIQSLYSIDSTDELSLEDVCTLPDE